MEIIGMLIKTSTNDIAMLNQAPGVTGKTADLGNERGVRKDVG